MNYDEISPGIRDIVIALNNMGFKTTDSGDGTNYKNGMECALPYRHVFGILPEAKSIREQAGNLKIFYPEAHVEVSYSPGSDAIFMLFPDGPPTEDQLTLDKEVATTKTLEDLWQRVCEKYKSPYAFAGDNHSLDELIESSNRISPVTGGTLGAVKVAVCEVFRELLDGSLVTE